MRSIKVVTQCTAALVVWTLALPALPLERPAAAQVIKTQVNLVNLFVTVRDKNKRIMGDLKQEDFKVAEDNQDQKIAFFSKEVSLPITLALLLDTSGSEQFMLGAIQEAGSAFLNRVLRKGDEALVMSFDSDVDLLSGRSAETPAPSGPGRSLEPLFMTPSILRVRRNSTPKPGAKRSSSSPTPRMKAAR